MATIELATGDIKSHESIELRGQYVFAYEGKDGLDYGEIARIYPMGSVVEIDPGESVVKGAPPAGDGIMLVPE